MKKLLFVFLLSFSFFASAAEVDLENSTFNWSATKVTGGHTGFISLQSGELNIDKSNIIKSGELVIKMDSMTVTDLTGKWAMKFLTHMKSSDFFEVKKYPTSKLVVSGDNGKEITGKLTIRGKTNMVVIPYKKVGKKYSGVLVFDRTKYDMVYGSGNFFKNLGDKLIHNEVKLNFEVNLK